MKKDKFTLLISKEEIHKKVIEIGKKINSDYKDKKEDVILICVLKGAFIFMADLVRNLEFAVICDFIRVSSYKGKKSTGNIKVVLGLDEEKIKNKHILIIEDIIDTGKTIKFLKDYISKFSPLTLKICTFILKEDSNIEVDYYCFKFKTLPFIVGYGLDFDEKYRNLPEILIYED